MEFLVALNTILLLLIIAYLIRSFKKKKPEPKVKLTDEEKEKLEKAKEAFQNLMEYDEDRALKRK